MDDEIYVVNADGTGLTNLTNFPETRFAMLTEFHPTWSPDGTRIAFSSFREDNFDIYVMNADGSDQTRITTHSGPDRDPAWSPDGTKIAFSSGRLLTPTGSSNNEIWSVSPDGSGETRLTSSVPANNFKPDWQRLNREPNCSGVAPTPGALWPPNRRFRTVTLSSAMDPDGDSVSASIDGVTQDERVGAQPDGRLSGDETVRLRAERDQRGDGRVYTIAFTATDDRGGSCSGTTSVEVRKHKHRPAVDSSPPSHDSLGP